MVSWEQAALFCNWLSVKESLPPVYIQQEGRIVAADPWEKATGLPTEAEWEFSARQGLTAKYPWGDAYPPAAGAGNYADESARGLIDVTIEGYNDGYAVAAPRANSNPPRRGCSIWEGTWPSGAMTTMRSTLGVRKEQVDPQAHGKVHTGS